MGHYDSSSIWGNVMHISSWKLWLFTPIAACLLAIGVNQAGLVDFPLQAIDDLTLLPRSWREWMKGLAAKYPGPVSFVPLWITLGSMAHFSWIRRHLATLWPDRPEIIHYDWESGFNEDNASVSFSARSPGQPFIGRDTQLKDLRDFDGGDKAVGQKWAMLTGRMWQGKSRLALEWLRALQNEGWDAGLLNENAYNNMDGIKKMKLRRPTAIMIDEAARHDYWPIVLNLLRRSIACQKPIRILLVEQTTLKIPAQPDEKETGAKDEKLLRDKQYHWRYRRTIKTADTQSYRLRALDNISANNLGTHYGLTPSEIKTAEGRAGLLCMSQSQRHEISRRAKDRLNMEHGPATETQLLALAALCGPFSTDHLANTDMARIALARRARLFEGETLTDGKAVINVKETIPSLRPKLFGDYILMHWAAGNQDSEIKALIEQGLSINPSRTTRNLTALLRRHNDGLQWHDIAVQLATYRPEQTAHTIAAEIAALRGEQHALGEGGDIDGMEDIHAEIAEIAAGWEADRGVMLEYALSLTCRISHFEGEDYLNETDHSLSLLRQLSETRFKDDATITWPWANALNSATVYVGNSDLPEKWERIKTYLSQLQILSETHFKDDAAIAECWASTLVNAANNVGESNLPDKWEWIETYLSQLQTLSETCFKDDATIAENWAMALVNVTNNVGTSNLPDKWERIETYLTHIETLSETRFKGDAAIAECWASTLVNAAYNVGSSDLPDKWERIETYLSQLQTLSEIRFTDDAAIALRWAMMLFNAINNVRTSDLPDKWERINIYLTQLQTLSETRFTDDAAIALRWAMALSNYANSIGASDLPDKWERIETYLTHIETLSETRFTDDAAIALRWAMALSNSINNVPQTRPKLFDRGRRDLKRLSRRWSMNHDIQSSLANHHPEYTAMALGAFSQ